jgi:hypothetical protein
MKLPKCHCQAHHDTPDYSFPKPEEVFALKSVKTDDTVFALKVYATAYCIQKMQLEHLVGEDPNLLDDCAHNLASGYQLEIPTVARNDVSN